MYTFLIGIAILIVGGFLYSTVLQKIFKTNKNYKTIAFLKQNNVDYVPMNKWRNAFVELKSIAGTGPILGPIQAVLFGPIVFLTIPIGNILGGILHDTFSGLISMRNGGAQNPEWIRRYLGKIVQFILLILTIVLSLLVAAVFITMPSKLIIGQIERGNINDVHALVSNPLLWVIVVLMFSYYVVATIFPIDKIIGKVYPTLSIILMVGTLFIFIGACTHGPTQIPDIWNVQYTASGLINPTTGHYIPLIFVTITCGMVSGFHSTQATVVGRTVKNEKDTLLTFSVPMIVEGVFAMIWAFVALELYQTHFGMISMWRNDATQLVGYAAHNLFWGPNWVQTTLGIFIIIVVALEAVTTGDTALRSSRLIIAEHFKVDQKPMKKRLFIASFLFVITLGLMFAGLFAPSGFGILWKYFAWCDQSTVAFAFAAITIYLMRKHEFYFISLIPGAFYAFVCFSFIIGSETQGINALLKTDSQHANCWIAAYSIGAFMGCAYIFALLFYGLRSRGKPNTWIEEPQIMLTNNNHNL